MKTPNQNHTTGALLAAVIALAVPCTSCAQEDWKLLPLEYNNPGLEVDLGVGLWAWPLPLDYDGDGDLDLVVSCPDKPSNGLYYFENPTQDPKVKMPVFKPGVRLGPTGQNMQVSFVNGKPRILRENLEFPKFREGDFETRTKIYPDTRFHPGQTRANDNDFCHGCRLLCSISTDEDLLLISDYLIFISIVFPRVNRNLFRY